MVILGIDPGYGITGFGVIKQIKGKKDSFECLDYGVITTSSKLPFSKRLKHLHDDLKQIIKKYKPDVMGIEKLFFYKNVKTATDVGQARGVILLTAMQANLPIKEFTPLQIKQSITGYGRADKKQIQEMVKILLNLKRIPHPDDAADALAAAITASR